MNTADGHRLRRVIDQIDRIERYTNDGRAEFDRNEMIQDAVMRCLTVIGEAAAALSKSTRAEVASLPLHLPKGMRNRLAHEYWRVDSDIVWATIRNDLPGLRIEVARLLG